MGLNTLKVGVFDAVICFNDGCVKRMEVLKKLGINMGLNMVTPLNLIDHQRVIDGDQFVLEMSKGARTNGRALKRKREDQDAMNQE